MAELLHNPATILFQFRQSWEGRDKRQERAAPDWHGRDLALKAGRVCVTKLSPYLIIAEKRL